MIRVGIIAVAAVCAVAYFIFGEFDSEIDNHDYKRPIIVESDGECVEVIPASTSKIIPVVTLGEPEIK